MVPIGIILTMDFMPHLFEFWRHARLESRIWPPTPVGPSCAIVIPQEDGWHFQVTRPCAISCDDLDDCSGSGRTSIADFGGRRSVR